MNLVAAYAHIHWDAAVFNCNFSILGCISANYSGGTIASSRQPA